MAMSDTGCCDWCGKRLPKGSRPSRKFHSDSCRQLAFQNRQRVTAKLTAVALPPDAQEDLKRLGQFSKQCADMVRHVANVAGRELAEEVLDGVWDVLVQTGCLDKLPELQKVVV